MAQTFAYDSVILPGMAAVSLCPIPKFPKSDVEKEILRASGADSDTDTVTDTDTDTDTLRQSHRCSVPANFEDLLPQLHTDSNELPEQHSRQMGEY